MDTNMKDTDRDASRTVHPYGSTEWLRQRAAVVLPSLDVDRATRVLAAIMDSDADVIDTFVALAHDAGSMVDVREIRERLVPEREHGQIPNVDAVTTVATGRRTLRGRSVVVGSSFGWNVDQSTRDAWSVAYGSGTSDELQHAADAFLRRHDALDTSTRLMGGEHLAFPEVIHAGIDAALPGVTSRHALINDALAAVRDVDVREMLANEHRARWNPTTLTFDVDNSAPRATHRRRLVRMAPRTGLRNATPRASERQGPTVVTPRFVRDKDTGRLVIRDHVTRGRHRRTFIVDVDGSTVSHVDALTIDARSTRSGTIDHGRDTFTHGHGHWAPRSGTRVSTRKPRVRQTFTTSTDTLASMARERAAALAPGTSVVVTDGHTAVTVSRPASMTAPFTVTVKVDGSMVKQARTRRPSTVATTVTRALANV